MEIQSNIFLKDLRFHAFHGVLPQERLAGNDYTVDLSIAYDVSQAMQTDDVAHTINYAEVFQLVAREMAQPSQLVEHVAGRIAQGILKQWPEATAVDLRITKLNPPMGADCYGAGVTIHLINDKIE